DLEAVADAQHRHPALRGVDHLLHHRCEAADRAGAQVVAVGEAAREHDGLDALQIVLAVPERDGLGAAEPHGAQRVPVVQRAREGHHTDAHQACASPWAAPSTSIATTSSMTGFDSRVSAASRREASTWSVTSPST